LLLLLALPDLELATVSASAVSGGSQITDFELNQISFYYAKQFQTVEIDSTNYGTPSESTVTSWYEKTPPDFVFAAVVPQVVIHEKVLNDCEAEFDEFVDRVGLVPREYRQFVQSVFSWTSKKCI
jgi:uncharacterized protein YecE (DUF72 family)